MQFDRGKSGYAGGLRHKAKVYGQQRHQKGQLWPLISFYMIKMVEEGHVGEIEVSYGWQFQVVIRVKWIKILRVFISKILVGGIIRNSNEAEGLLETEPLPGDRFSRSALGFKE